ncbi:uncharacterized protein LOC133832815 [Humulus lupulus]|uniref:uncharacterized protein LOC133832815 n=1 Tax=Humulus lupulus TaxID=3486 RepID=UPI002B407B68|nr:uncharacterized protein LOC133832815 [Humulus lupulus]
MEMKREQSNEILSKCLESLSSANVSLERIIKNVAVEKTDDDDDVKFIKGIEKSDSMRLELELTEELLEKRELENSVVSLTEENRDTNNLLRAALLENEAVEKRLKVNSEQKRVALLQIAERGLQRVGFGFMMGSGNTEQSLEIFSGTKSDSSECEEDAIFRNCFYSWIGDLDIYVIKIVGLLKIYRSFQDFDEASTVERIMKNLRLEITKLRRSLEESRLEILPIVEAHVFDKGFYQGYERWIYHEEAELDVVDEVIDDDEVDEMIPIANLDEHVIDTWKDSHLRKSTKAFVNDAARETFEKMTEELERARLQSQSQGLTEGSETGSAVDSSSIDQYEIMKMMKSMREEIQMLRSQQGPSSNPHHTSSETESRFDNLLQRYLPSQPEGVVVKALIWDAKNVQASICSLTEELEGNRDHLALPRECQEGLQAVGKLAE